MYCNTVKAGGIMSIKESELFRPGWKVSSTRGEEQNT